MNNKGHLMTSSSLQDTPSYFSCLGTSELMLLLINSRFEKSSSSQSPSKSRKWRSFVWPPDLFFVQSTLSAIKPFRLVSPAPPAASAPMMPRRSLACLAVLLACAAVSAQPFKKGGQTIARPYPDCAHYTVTSDRSMSFVDLQSTLRFAVLPSDLQMSLRIIVGESQYTIVVLPDDTVVTRCDGQAQQNRCTPLQQRRVSGADLLKQGEWNFVDLGFDGHKIRVLISDVEVLVDDSWVATAGQESIHSAKVAFLSLKDASLDSSPNYALEVNLECDSTHTPDQEINTHPPVNTTSTEVSPAREYLPSTVEVGFHLGLCRDSSVVRALDSDPRGPGFNSPSRQL
ncbi:uncharacterized protein LOC134763083 [Penaeus indicus]|uniref:uncharacterized protein LOC134763083 n=1 Tax=Penaeus indicus TaxID=29960 RepID=UPI00300C5833